MGQIPLIMCVECANAKDGEQKHNNADKDECDANVSKRLLIHWILNAA